jgi:RNase P/RNase MRP subunit p29
MVCGKQGRDWRVSRIGRESLVYEERVGDRWERLEIDGEMLTGRPDYVIYFDSAAKWKTYPEWARNRRHEILQRVKEACPAPDYAHEGEFELEWVERFQRHTVTITRPAGSKIYIEPWANEYSASLGDVLEIELKGPACGCQGELVVENEQATVTVRGWTGCTVKVRRNGQLVGRSDHRVPEVPGHAHRVE